MPRFGTPQVFMSLRLAGLRYSSACHSIPVTQVFKKVSLSSGLLIRGFGVRVPDGAPVRPSRFDEGLVHVLGLPRHRICHGPGPGQMRPGVSAGTSGAIACGVAGVWVGRPLRVGGTETGPHPCRSKPNVKTSPVLTWGFCCSRSFLCVRFCSYVGCVFARR
jgi:hypothetical protein